MIGCPVKAFGISGCLLLLICLFPAHADPFFVRVYGRTYKIDPRSPSDEAKGLKPQEAMKALPSDLARGPGFRPSHEQVLAEVEERLWIARSQLDRVPEKAAAAPELQKIYERHRALNLLARELRRSMDLPVRPPGAGFSRPKLSPEIEASYRTLKFDPLEAYDGFRRVKAAFRSGDISLLASVAHYPLTLTGKAKRTIRTPEQLLKVEDMVMDPHIREVVARSTFETAFVRDKGMMLGGGEVWIIQDKTGFGLGAVNLR